MIVGIIPLVILAWAKPTSKGHSYLDLILLRRKTASQSLEHVLVLRSLINTVIVAALFGTLTGLIVIMANLSDPDKIGPGLAVALLTMLYGFLVAGVLEAYKAYFQADIEYGLALSLKNNTTTMFGAMSMFMLLFASFVVLFGAKS